MISSVETANNISEKLVALLSSFFPRENRVLINRNRKLNRKNPHKIAIIQSGLCWQLPFSKRSGPILPILTRKSGAQFIPRAEENGSKLRLKGILKKTKTNTITNNPITNWEIDL